MGNPPFGHAGELAISTWFQQEFGADSEFFSQLGAGSSSAVQDFFNFEGNAQAIRIVSNVELLVHCYGLNFTAGTLSAAGKYLAASNEVGKNGWHEFSKPGYFTSEAETFRLVREATGTLGCRHPITYFVEASDDIVYCSVDLEDGIRRGVLIWDSVEAKLRKESEGSPLVERALAAAKKHAGPLKDQGRAYYEALAQTFRIAAISEMAVSARDVFKLRYADIMNGNYHHELLMDEECEARPLINACKHILRADLYRHPDILRLEIRGRKVIHELLQFFLGRCAWLRVLRFESRVPEDLCWQAIPIAL
jgi:dGTPase